MKEFDALSGQISVIPVGSTLVAEVNIHRFEVIGVAMVALYVFLICREHQCSIPALFLTFMAVMHEGGLASSWSGAPILQELTICLLTCSELLFFKIYCFFFIIRYSQVFSIYVVVC